MCRRQLQMSSVQEAAAGGSSSTMEGGVADFDLAGCVVGSSIQQLSGL
jgi:hypothetical protein